MRRVAMRSSVPPDADEAPERAHRRRRRLARSVVAVLGVALLVAGCGVEGQDLTGTDQTQDSTAPAGLDPAEATVSKEQLASTDPDSPERTVLTWWRAVQSRDAEGVIDSYTKKVRKDLPGGFEFSVVSLIAPVASSAAISIASVETNGGKGGKQGDKDKGSGGDDADKAMLYATLDTTAPRFAGSLALPLKTEDGAWKIDDSTFLVALASQYNSDLQSFGNAAQSLSEASGETTTGG